MDNPAKGGVVRSFASVSRQRQAEAAKDQERAPEESGEREESQHPDACAEPDEETEADADVRRLDEQFTGVGKCNVHRWIEVMNQAGADGNEVEMELTRAKARHRARFDHITRTYAELKAQHGHAMERSKPYFEATQALTAASQRVQDAVNEFSAAASQHSQAKKDLRELDERLEGWSHHQVSLTREQQEKISRATEQVTKCQEERDKREAEYARALQEYNEAQRTAENWQQHIGHSTVRAVQPAWRHLQQEQAALAAEQAAIAGLEAKTLPHKKAYKAALKALELISDQVRLAREAHFKAKRDAAAAVESPEVTHPEPREDREAHPHLDGKPAVERDPFAVASPRRTTPRRAQPEALQPSDERRDCPFA